MMMMPTAHFAPTLSSDSVSFILSIFEHHAENLEAILPTITLVTEYPTEQLKVIFSNKKNLQSFTQALAKDDIEDILTSMPKDSELKADFERYAKAHEIFNAFHAIRTVHKHFSAYINNEHTETYRQIREKNIHQMSELFNQNVYFILQSLTQHNRPLTLDLLEKHTVTIANLKHKAQAPEIKALCTRYLSLLTRTNVTLPTMIVIPSTQDRLTQLKTEIIDDKYCYIKSFIDDAIEMQDSSPEEDEQMRAAFAKHYSNDVALVKIDAFYKGMIANYLGTEGQEDFKAMLDTFNENNAHELLAIQLLDSGIPDLIGASADQEKIGAWMQSLSHQEQENFAFFAHTFRTQLRECKDTRDGEESELMRPFQNPGDKGINCFLDALTGIVDNNEEGSRWDNMRGIFLPDFLKKNPDFTTFLKIKMPYLTRLALQWKTFSDTDIACRTLSEAGAGTEEKYDAPRRALAAKPKEASAAPKTQADRSAVDGHHRHHLWTSPGKENSRKRKSFGERYQQYQGAGHLREQPANTAPDGTQFSQAKKQEIGPGFGIRVKI